MLSAAARAAVAAVDGLKSLARLVAAGGAALSAALAAGTCQGAQEVGVHLGCSTTEPEQTGSGRRGGREEAMSAGRKCGQGEC